MSCGPQLYTAKPNIRGDGPWVWSKHGAATPLDGFLRNLIEAPYNLVYAFTHPAMVGVGATVQLNGRIEDPEVAESLMRFIYYGASCELFFVSFSCSLSSRRRPVEQPLHVGLRARP